MAQRVTIVMYHFVRDQSQGRYPGVRGLGVQQFRDQLDYLARYHQFVTMEEVLSAFAGNHKLPTNAALVSFDDGYVDHYTNVFPILMERKIQGTFFVPAAVVREHKVLDVNKIHYILAVCKDKKALLAQLCEKIEDRRERWNLKSAHEYTSQITEVPRFDPKEVNLFKRLLQWVLPSPARGEILDELFAEHMDVSEGVLSRELYLSVDQIKLMRHSGMFIGCHGYSHSYMHTLSPHEQAEDVHKSLDLLSEIGADPSGLVMCYPYGSYNEALVEVLQQNNFKLGFADSVDITSIDPSMKMILPRLDTNDLPKSSTEGMSEWTKKALSPPEQRPRQPLAIKE